MTRKMETKDRKEGQCDRCKKWMRKDNLEHHQGTCKAIEEVLHGSCHSPKNGPGTHLEETMQATYMYQEAW